MKLLAINGSHKPAGGICQLIIDHLFKGANEDGAACGTIRLSKYNINRCIACEYCQNQNEYTCVFDEKDDFLKIIETIKQSDLLIFATPVYLFQISSLMKTFLERYHSRGKSRILSVTKSHLLFHDAESQLCNKPFVSIIASDNIESRTTKNAAAYFDAFSRFMDAPHAGNIIRNGCVIFKSTNNKFGKIADNIFQNLEIAGKELVKSGFISKKTESRINKKILPVPLFAFNIMKRTKTGRIKILENAKEI